MKWIDRLFNEHKAARRLSLIWACWLCTVVVFKTFDSLELIDGARATLIATFFGVLVTVIGFYQWHRNKDDEHAPVSTDDSQ